MNIRGNFTFSAAAPPADGNGKLLRLKPANHADIRRLCPSETSNFVHYPGLTEVGGRGDVNNFQNLGSQGGANETYLLDIQPSQYDRNMVRNKLINSDNSKGSARRPHWYKDGKLVWGSTIIGGTVELPQSVRVRTNADGSLKVSTFNVDYDGWKPNTTFVEIDGLREEDKGRPVEELIREGRILYWYEINSTPDNITRSLGGVTGLFQPMWNDLQWPSNYGRPVYYNLEYFEGF